MPQTQDNFRTTVWTHQSITNNNILYCFDSAIKHQNWSSLRQTLADAGRSKKRNHLASTLIGTVANTNKIVHFDSDVFQNLLRVKIQTDILHRQKRVGSDCGYDYGVHLCLLCNFNPRLPDLLLSVFVDLIPLVTKATTVLQVRNDAVN